MTNPKNSLIFVNIKDKRTLLPFHLRYPSSFTLFSLLAVGSWFTLLPPLSLVAWVTYGTSFALANL